MSFVESRHPEVFVAIKEKKQLDDEVKGKIKTALEAFNKVFVA